MPTIDELVAEDTQARQALIEQAHIIAEQAQRISDLYALLQKALEHAPVITKNKVAHRLSEMGMEPAGEVTP